MVKVDLSGVSGFLHGEQPELAAAERALGTLLDGSGPGAEFTGWRQLPQKMRQGELPRLLEAARRVRESGEALVVVGVGGSYLGARAGFELLRPRGGAELIFAGNSLSPDDLHDKLELLGDRDFCVNVISKSGTTLEPAAAFRVFRALAEKKYGPRARAHIIATTDARRGALKTLADEKGYETFTVPDDVGGRFSVLSAVGLLPLAAAGCDAAAITDAAVTAMRELLRKSPENPALRYAAARNALYAAGYQTELLACGEPSFRFMAEWWKQLFGESEGKNGKGIFPASVEYNADLHSMGQYIQEGPRNLMETVVRFAAPRRDEAFPGSEKNEDGLDYLCGKTLFGMSEAALDAVRDAHIAGGVPNITLTAPRRDEAGFAQLVCFFETACAVSAYMQGVNPFDQPGVEAYKKNMFRLLGKPM